MNALVQRLLSLLEGVEGSYTCTCGRRLKVGLSTELWQTKLLVEAQLREACNTAQLGNSVTPEEGTRFALLEVDP